MTRPPPICIAAALIEHDGRLLLVRKAGTRWFMQPGGKVEPGEAALDALRRELREEIGFDFATTDAHPLGTFTAPAANEPGHTVEAALFHIRAAASAVAHGEIAEAAWLAPSEAALQPLAPLTRNHVLPLFHVLCGSRSHERQLRLDSPGGLGR